MRHIYLKIESMQVLEDQGSAINPPDGTDRSVEFQTSSVREE